MTRSIPGRRLGAASLTGLLLAGIGAIATATPAAAGTTIDVAQNGRDSNSGSSRAPLATIQAAIDKATPGATIRVHKGTYSQQLKIRKSGTATAPITITNAGDGPVTVTSSQSPDSCSNSQPSPRRTILVQDGSDHWTFKGLNIVHGAYLSGTKANVSYGWHARLVKAGVWQPRRQAPGRSTYNPAAARNVVGYLRQVTGNSSLNSADGISFIGNTITSRGIYSSLSSYGTISGNRISNIICGSGPGIWLMNFSDGWTITGNDVSKIAPSTRAHYMQEGIRLGSSANYNWVTGNTVHDLTGDGRAFNTDVDSSFNTFKNNVATNVAIGYNDQMSGWGNRWEYNTVTSFRQYGFGARLMDAKLASPSMSTSTNGMIVRCNVVSKPIGNAKSLGVGGMMRSTFSGNAFTTTWISKNALRYWTSQGNSWNGSRTPPGPTVTPTHC